MFQEKESHWIECGALLKNNRFKRNIIIKENEIDEFIKEFKNQGIYRTAYSYMSEDIRKSEMIGDLYFDFDSDSDEVGYEKVREDVIRTIAFMSSIFGIDEKQIRIYFSGKKGIHLIIKKEVLGIRWHENLNEIFKLIALDVSKLIKNKTLDERIYDKVRLLRVPGSIHQETGMYKIELSYEELIDLSYKEIKRLARKERIVNVSTKSYNTKASMVYNEYVKEWEQGKRSLNKKRGDMKLDFCPPCVKSMLNNEAMSGKRNNTLAALSSYCKQRGYSEEEAFDRMMEWSEKFCRPSLKKSEVELTVRSIYRGNYIYGCGSLESISGVCNKENCKIGKKRSDNEYGKVIKNSKR